MENNIDTRLKETKIFLTIITVLVVVGCLFLLWYNWARVKSLSGGPNKTTAVTVFKTSPIEFGLQFPKGLINEKDVLNVVDSFRAIKSGDKTQYTYKFNSLKSISEMFRHFEAFTRTGEWKQVGVIKEDGYFGISSFSNGVYLDITLTENKGGKGTVVDVTMVK